MLPNLIEHYHSIFNTLEKPRTFFAPGRINLIGEHLDYNGGHVFPATISFGTYALTRKRADRKLRLYSMNFPDYGVIECDLNSLENRKEDDWANFPKGIVKYLIEFGYEITSGLDILYYGNIPNGAGLSSSASIELATGVLLDGLFNLNIDRIDLIKLGRKVENEYIGVNSGIMDQFSIGKGKKDKAILLDCKTLNYSYVPIKLENHVIVIINTNKQRTLSTSKYNERRSQCETALTELQAELPIQSLCELTKEEFEHHKHLIKDDVNMKRAKHAVYENARTIEATKQLEIGNLSAFGQLMNESHKSLQIDYEVTGLELDTIVSAAWEQPGVIGARMTGAGFGGCAIAIVEKEQIDNFKNQLKKIYTSKIGYSPTFYMATIGDGAKEITKECAK